MKNFGFGFMRLPFRDDKVDIGLVRQMVDLFMENGFNYFDTAYKYCRGLSEPALREALVDRYPRESYVLTTKLSNEFMRRPEEQEQVFEDQLNRLGWKAGNCNGACKGRHAGKSSGGCGSAFPVLS